MAEFRLTRSPALGGLDETLGTTTLREIDGAKILTLTLARGEEDKGRKALANGLGCPAPEIGKATYSSPTGAHVLRLGADRLMILHLPQNGAGAGPEVALPPGQITRVDQSHHWVLLDLSGPLMAPALERSCRLDLHGPRLGPGSLARTPIEGVSTILLRLETDRILLMAPRSYANSLAKTLLTSLRYVSE